MHQNLVKSLQNLIGLLELYVRLNAPCILSKECYELDLKNGIDNIPFNMILCYNKLIELDLVGEDEIILLNAWLQDIHLYNKTDI